MEPPVRTIGAREHRSLAVALVGGKVVLRRCRRLCPDGLESLYT
jgi:hypothetical protein